MGDYARDEAYPPPPDWEAIYARFFPYLTDSCSRHVKTISETLRDTESPVRQMMMDAGYEPDHWAEAMEKTVEMLWEARAEGGLDWCPEQERWVATKDGEGE